MTISVVLLLSIFVIVSFIWAYFINIYEVKYISNKELLIADDSSLLNIDVIPLNSFGYRALFRSAEADFYIEKGEHLIDIVSAKMETGRFTIRSRNVAGEVIILIKCPKSYSPIKMVIPIEEKK